MIEFVGPAPPLDEVEQDLFVVEGLQGQARPGFSVVNSEYFAFHAMRSSMRSETWLCVFHAELIMFHFLW